MEFDIKPLIRFLEHLPQSGDIELAILKCHLLIEELLTKVIIDKAINPDYVMKARLTFSQKIHLARAFSQLEDKTWLWGAIKKLNDTRNELAHELSAEEIKNKYNSFIIMVEDAHGKPEDDLLSQKFNRFHWAAFKVFSVLAAYAHLDIGKLRMQTLLTGFTNMVASPENSKPHR